MLAKGLGLALAFLLGSSTGLVRAQTGADSDVEAGESYYRGHCRICHGRAGEGDRGPALNRGEFERARTDDELAEILLKGIPGTGMPGAVDSQYKSRQVVAYLRSLAVSDSEPPTGDPTAGESLFRNAGGCLACHMVNGVGASIAPELSAIGRMRAAASLRRSLIDPDADVEKRYWSAEVELRNGDARSGTLIDEDTFSLRLMDAEGNLHSFLKAEVASVEVGRSSSMTSYEGMFSASEIDDVVAYLSTLKGRP